MGKGKRVYSDNVVLVLAGFSWQAVSASAMWLSSVEHLVCDTVVGAQAQQVLKRPGQCSPAAQHGSPR